MPSSVLVDLVKVVITSTGTGPLVLGPAVQGFDGLNALVDGKQYSYSIQTNDGNFEVGVGAWVAATNTLVRTVEKSSNGGAPISVSPGTTLSFIARAADLGDPSAITGDLQQQIDAKAGLSLANVFSMVQTYLGGLRIKGAAGTTRPLTIQTADLARWQIGGSADAESGSNAGTRLYVARYDDTGAIIDYPIIIDRSTGVVSFLQTPLVAGSQVVTFATLPPSGLADGSVTNAKLANAPAGTFKGNTGSSAGTPGDVTYSQVKTALSLDQVNNTSDANKPVSTPQQAALNGKLDTSSFTKSNIGLGNVDNTSDANKPVSTAQQTALNGKLDASALLADNGSLQGVQQNGTRSGLRTLYARVQEDMRVTDFYNGVAGANAPQARSGFVNSFDDTPYWQAAIDACLARGETRLRVPKSFYRIGCDGTPLNIKVPLYLIGDSTLEGGQFTGITGNGNWGETATGSWIKAQPANGSGAAIKFTVGVSRGSRIENIGVIQDHPTVASGWVPNSYDYAFDASAAGGRVEFDNVTLLAVSRGIKGGGRLKVGRLNSQCFVNTVSIDNALDVVRIDHIHEYPYWSTDNIVLGYTQGSRDMLIIARCDGFFGGKIFSICGKSTVRIVDNSTGPCTDFHVNSLYSDLSKSGLSVEASGFRGRVDFLKAQCEAVNSSASSGGTGYGIAGSNGVNFLGAASGGVLDIGTLRAERFGAWGVNNTSNSLISIDNHTYYSLSSGAGPWFSYYNRIRLKSRELYSGGMAGGSESYVERALTNYDNGFPGPYPSDGDAASGGVGLNDVYRKTGGSLVWRQS